MLRPGGLGAFFPNAEAIGLPPGVIVDRDAANGALAPVPRGYYPPDARLQYSVARRQGLGAANSNGSTRTAPHRLAPGYGANANGAQSNLLWSPNQPGQNPNQSQGNGWSWNNTGYQAGNANQGSTAGTPVPSNWPQNRTYVDASGNVWAYQATSGTWVIQSQSNYSSVVPSNWPTSQPYIDNSGNTWTWSGSGGWQITTYANAAATAAAASSATTPVATTTAAPSWFTDPTQELINGVPNWGLVAGGAALIFLLKRK
jgi:hypothetical protein